MSGERPGIVLVGMMGSGKTKVGKVLAGRLGCDFSDTDGLVTERTGLGIPEIFARDGEARFRAEESAAIRALAGRGPAGVVATGGGAVLSADNRGLLRGMGVVFYLSASAPVLAQRLANSKVRRPLLENGRDTEQLLGDLLRDRDALYAGIADERIEIGSAGTPKRDIADEVLARLEARRRP